MSFMTVPSVNLIVAKPRSGKSWLIKYLCYYLYENKMIDNIYIYWYIV